MPLTVEDIIANKVLEECSQDIVDKINVDLVILRLHSKCRLTAQDITRLGNISTSREKKRQLYMLALANKGSAAFQDIVDVLNDTALNHEYEPHAVLADKLSKYYQHLLSQHSNKQGKPQEVKVTVTNKIIETGAWDDPERQYSDDDTCDNDHFSDIDYFSDSDDQLQLLSDVNLSSSFQDNSDKMICNTRSPVKEIYGSTDELQSSELSFPVVERPVLEKSPYPLSDMIVMKLLLLGNSGVGKTSLVYRFLHKTFYDLALLTTGGIRNHCYLMHTKKMVNIELTIWDIAGQERFHCISSNFYHNVDVVIMVFDMTSRKSLHAVEDWNTQLHLHMSKDIPPIILAGNKCESSAVNKGISRHAEHMVNVLGFNSFMEVSAKENILVETLFERAVDLALATLETQEWQQAIATRDSDKQPNEQKGSYFSRLTSYIMGSAKRASQKQSEPVFDQKIEDSAVTKVEEYVARLKNNYEEELSANKTEINQLNETLTELEMKQNETKRENEMLKIKIDQMKESSKGSTDDVRIKKEDMIEAKLKSSYEKKLSANEVEIIELNDTVTELKIKQNEAKSENKMLKRRIEQLRESSKKELQDLEYQNKINAENEKLKQEIENLRKSSKFKSSVDFDSGDVSVSSKLLKNGSYYVAYEAQYCGKQCIAKTRDSKNKSSKKLLKREKKFLVRLNHPFVVHQLAVLDSQKSPVLLMEEMQMSLTEFLTNKHSRHDKISILRDAACGLCYIHEKGIIHCDLSGDNILLTKNNTAKLANFGRAAFYQKKTVKYYLPENLDHMPPEIFEPYSKTSYSTKVDVFSFGCVIIHTFTQERPIPHFGKYVETSEGGRYKKHSEVERRSVCLRKFKNNCKCMKLHDIVLKCLQDNPDCRPTAVTLLSLLENQLAMTLPSSFKFEEDICPQVSLKSEKCETSIPVVLVKQLHLLTALNISGCNITDQGADMVAEVLLQTVSLTKLDLSSIMLNSPKAAKIFSMLKNISSLKVFSINNNKIDDRTANSIAAVICSNSLIQKINLSHNKLTYTGVLNIANSLSQNIQVFDISHNFITSDDIVDLATALSKCSVLQELNMSHNLLTLTNVLTIAQTFRHHPTLQSLDLSSNAISFFSACEFIVDVILSVNQKLVNLNVSGRNIRPRYVEDYLSPPSCESDYNKFTLQSLYLLQHSSLHVTDTQTNFVKVAETCPISNGDVLSYYVDHLGGVFYNQYHNFAVVIPPGAVSQGDCVEIQATANCFGPYKIPDGFYPISSFFWLSANYEFKAPVYFIMNHYAKIRSLEDINNMHVLYKCIHDPDSMTDDFMTSTIADGVYFDYEIGYCVLAADHFCTYCEAKTDKLIPEYLLACYYTYDESSTGQHIAEVCFCPSNYNCKKLINEQCKKRNTEIKQSVTFDIANGEELYISSIDFSSISNREWKLTKTGKPNIVHLQDFEFWKIFDGLTVEQRREREESFDYPPRLRIECLQIDATKPLYSSFEVSKMHNKKVIGEFSLIRQVTVSVQAAVQPTVQQLISAEPLQHRIFLYKPKMRILNKIVIPKVSAEWEDIAYELEYEISTVRSIRNKHKEDPTKCCKELFEDWLTTDNGAKPKMWKTLLDKFKEIENLSSVTGDITERLIEMDSQV